jgi:glutathione S-transferase
MADAKPVLWHIPVSHFSEKARWALAYKGVEYERRAPLPGAHMAIALWLTRGASNTFPVLELDGRSIGDSSEIIAALEWRWPDPPLYPADPDERRRALELEEFFDEQLGPPIRLLGWHELCADPERMARLSRTMVPEPLQRFRSANAVAARFGPGFVKLRYRVASDEAADQARRKVLAALDRIETELERTGGKHLASDGFSVADLTAAALFYPLVNPPEGPRLLDDPPAGFQAFREPLMSRPGYLWIAETFRRYRPPGAQASSTIASTSTGTSKGS